jgi:hypothetical protein
MWRSNPVRYCGFAMLLLFLHPVPDASAQGMQSILRADARVFPSIGPGVSDLKRDSAGRYYILAEPATRISIYDAAGKQIGQIPNANSRGVTIDYAVGIDVDSADRLFVVDRGANAIRIFAPDGSPVATVPVNAPTSVVALSGGQFAVTTLISKRLVQIMDESGKVIRSFGDPADVAPAPRSTTAVDELGRPVPPPPPTLADRGRIVGDPAGNIYFSFASLPDPTFQRFDRFGYSAYEAVIPRESFGAQNRPTGRVEVGYSMSALGWPTSFSAWTDFHSISGLSVSEHGRRGRGAGVVSGPGSSGSSLSSSTDADFGNVTTQGNTLAYSDDADGVLSSSDDTDTLNDYYAGNMGTGFMMPGMFGMGIGGFFHGHMGGMFDHPGGTGGAGGPEAGAGEHPDFGDHAPGEDGPDHFHFHPGFDEYRARASVRIRLDNPPPGADGKPVIRAVGVDPLTHDVWEAVGDTLVHFDSSGAREETYYLLLTDGASLKPTSILVEPNRLLIAADPWGIYEFPRPDRPSYAAHPLNPAPASNGIVPQQVNPAQRAHRQPLSQTSPSAPSRP